MVMKGRYLERATVDAVQESLRHYPVTAIVGPRQCGRSTLVRHLLGYEGELVSLDLERPSDRRKLEEPEWFLSRQRGRLVCIDEVQRRPELFALTGSLVDEWGGNGHFLILGSASPGLLRESSESLAGRITYRRLTPFLWEEVRERVRIEEYLSRGGFPGSLLQRDDAVSFGWREDFITGFLERDLLQWRGFSPGTMRRLWQMLAHGNARTLNLSSIGGALGISHTSVRNYIDLLEETFMVTSLPPLPADTGKRLVRSPKVYLGDTGIVAALLGLGDFSAIAGHQVFGSLRETLVLVNIQGLFPRAELSYYRTTNGAEIDIVMERSGKRIAVECRASVSPALTRGNTSAIADLAPLHTFVVAPVEEGYPLREGVSVVSLSELAGQLAALLAA